MPLFYRFYPKGAPLRLARQRLMLLITLLLAVSSGMLWATIPVSAQSPGAALDFDGVDDYVTLPASLNDGFGANQITLEGWFYPTAQPGANQYFTWIGEAYTSDANVKFAIYQFGANVICGFYQNSWSATPGVAVTLNQWQHVACSYDQQNIKLYVNGAVAATAAASAALPTGDGAWYLGQRWDGTDYYKGRMDEVRIWNRALSASEIADRMNCEPGGDPSGLVARYSFNQGNAQANNSGVTSLTDSSSNAINGTLSGFALSGSASNWVAPGSAASGVACATAPEIDVQGNGVSIPSGDTTPSTADDSNFGRQTTGNTVAHTFTINNSGAAALTGVAVTLNGSSAFQLTATPTSSVAAGGSSNFTISFTPSAVGAYTATVSIASNDSNENPYTFVVQGIWTDSNVAISQAATQSSTYPDDCTGAASKAVDGNTSGDASACSFSTTNNQPQDWWQVDLGAAYLIQAIDIWNRTDCCGDRLSNFDLLVSTDGSNWTTFYYPGAASTTTSFVINGVGLYVKVQLRGQNYLTLAEVQVWGTNIPEIDVLGNGMSIASGDSTPSTSDDTDFGRLTTSDTVAHIFTLYNSGAAALTGVTATLNGDSAFSLTSTPASSVAARDSSSFTIEFTPSAVGAYTATVSIASNDSDENPYTFVVQGIWTGSNIAIGQLATQSSTYNDPCTGPASNAVDGDTAGDPGSCSFSTTNNENPQDWWQVDLGAAYLIQVIDLWNRTDCCYDRLSNFDLLVSTDGSNWTTFYYPDTAPTTTSFVINAPVRYVKVQLRGQNYLTLAEVQVWGPALPEIDVQGNGVSIANGDSTPTANDQTDFGNQLPGNTAVRPFTLRNQGAAALALSGSPRVTLSGDSAFTISSQPASNSVAANSSVPFTITFAPSAVGFVTATVSIANDDGNENPYTFVVGGTGVTANVQLNGVGCLLIDAINAANSDAASGSCPAGSGTDSITLLQDVTLSVVDNADYNNTGANGLPQISSAISIEGGGHTISRTASAPAFRFFFVADGGNLTLNNLTLTNGDVTPSNRKGGALYNAYGGTATVNNSTLNGNISFGGAIFNDGDLTVNQSTVSGNTATGNGGGIENWGTLKVNDSTVSGNSAGANGGGLYNGRTLTVTNSTISDNGGSSGGGLYNWGKLTVINSTVSGNRSGSGGGLNNEYGGRALVNNSTFAANAAIGIGSGGGIRNDSSSKMTVNNSTLSANTAGNGAGGILNGGTMTVTNSTLSANSASYGGGLANSGTLTLNRALIAGNSATNDPEIYSQGGTVTADSYNLIGYGGDARSSGFTPGATDIVPSGALATILTTTLADNGGPSTGPGAATWTHALVAGSPALDAAGDSGLATDQRGVTRPQGAADDIGAFELEPAPEMNVQGNGVSIVNGDSTPDSADHTAFGNVTVESSLQRTFTISNSGNADLTDVLVTIDGSACAAGATSCIPAGDFTLVSAPDTTIAAGDSSSFTIEFAPTAAGLVEAVVSIASNDSNENPYTFAVNGNGIALTQITIVLDAVPNLPTNLGFQGSFGPFILDDPALDDSDAYTNTKSFTVAPGSYTVRRNNPAGWFTTAIVCTPDGKGGTNVAQRSAAITVAEGDNVTCTFTVERAVVINTRAFNDLVRRNTNLGKRNAGDPWLNGQPMTLTTSPTQTLGSGVTAPVGNASQVSFVNLRPGSYTVCTAFPADWTLTTPTDVDPAYGQPCKTVTLTPGQAATVLFGAYQSTVIASESVTAEDELITDEDTIVEQPYDPAEDETATEEDGAPRLFLPLVVR